DFPAPLGPANPVTTPGRTVKDMPSRARAAPKRLYTSSTTIMPPLYGPCGPAPVPSIGTWLGPAAGMGDEVRGLVAEDFEVLARPSGPGLRREGMGVDVVLDGADALDRLALTRYDVVVLDRDLPGVHGDEICRRLVADGAGTRVLMLTAAAAIEDRVDGLGL